MYFVFHTYDL